MKISVCDICYKDKEKQVSSGYRVGFRNGLKIDTCEEHKNVAKSHKTAQSFAEWFYGIKEKV